MKFCCVLTTTPNIKEARELAGLLLFKRLAACVQLVPGIESHYHWKGKKETSKEILLILKTKSALFERLKKAILRSHSYEVPEIVCLPIAKGSKSYLDWIVKETIT